MQELTNLISEYLTSFYNRKIFIKQIECNSIQQNIVKQYEHFLTQQMSEIGEEIDLLKKRIEILSGEADIQDILQLISLCGSAISIDNISSAQDLLDYISNLMSTSTENDSIQWYTLMNVRTMLEERVTFLDEIQFITWVIAQKIQLSKELKSIRNKQRTLLKKLQKEEKQLHDEKHSLDTVVTNTEHQIRELRKTIPKFAKLNISIDTVDGFQGKECDIVLFGLTRTRGSFRFLADERRLNVALSRAKDQIIIVGNREYASKHTLLEKVCSACKVLDVSKQL